MEETDGAMAWLMKSCEVRWMDRISMPLRSPPRDSLCRGAEGSEGVRGSVAFVWSMGGLVWIIRITLKCKPYCRKY